MGKSNRRAEERRMTMAKMTPEEMKHDFINKNDLLHSHYVGVSPFDFIGDVWKDQDELMMILEDDMYKVASVDDVFDTGTQRNDVYVPPCSFLKGCYRNKTADELFAFVIDIDNITAWGLGQVIKNQLNNTIPLPTYIVNSGSGVHFYYVLEKPVPFYNVNRQQMKKIYERLWYVCDRNIGARVEKHNLIQPYRLPGSLTKLNQVAAAFSVYKKWDADQLMARLGIEETKPITYWDPNGYKTERPKKVTYPTKGQPNGDAAFYDYCYNRILDKTVEGHRYTSMYALSVVAYKTNTSFERLKTDLEFLWQKFNATGSYMKHKELEKALKGYTPARERVTSATLEDWFGWPFMRNTIRRNGRKQEEHLKRNRIIQDVLNPDWRNTKGRPTSKELIKKYLQEHPAEKNVSKIARECGVSRPTVYKYFKK